MSVYADVVVDIKAGALDKPFQYRIPEEMMDTIRPGMVVMVPFGKGNRETKAYVIGFSSRLQLEESRIKEIRKIVTDGLDSEEKLVALAAWMKEQYGSTMLQALRVCVPVRKKIAPQEKKYLHLAVGQTVAAEQLEVFQHKKQSARQRLLSALMQSPEIPWDIARNRLNITLSTAESLEEMGLITISREKVFRDTFKAQEGTAKKIILSDEQEKAARTVISRWDLPPEEKKYLLYGVTGSGKTEVYMELIEEAIRRGQQAIVLIPEIALTWQTVMRFYNRFGDRVSMVNSRLSTGERYDQFEKARKGLVDVMIGPRSALFTPFPDLGIIVIDEEHERSYQSEQSPRYHAAVVAARRAKMEDAVLVLGSATPSLEAFHAAGSGTLHELRLTHRNAGALLPQTSIVDMRQELKAGNRSIFSRELVTRLQETLEQGNQAMLFLNRRGFAGFISCRSCGSVIKCPHCDVSLSLHRGGKLICHYC